MMTTAKVQFLCKDSNNLGFRVRDRGSVRVSCWVVWGQTASNRLMHQLVTSTVNYKW